MSDARVTWPAAERNKAPILEVFRRVAPARGLVLEVGSGTGQHIAHLAAALSHLEFQPSEFDLELHASIAAWNEDHAHVRTPLALDVTAAQWPVERAAMIYSANMIHIAPFAACLGLLDGAARTLDDAGALLLYGPFKRKGTHTAPSNAAFDESLQARNPSWGVRDLDEVESLANERELHLKEIVEMPANNLCVLFSRVAS